MRLFQSFGANLGGLAGARMDDSDERRCSVSLPSVHATIVVRTHRDREARLELDVTSALRTVEPFTLELHGSVLELPWPGHELRWRGREKNRCIGHSAAARGSLGRFLSLRFPGIQELKMNPIQRVKLAVAASLAAASLWACTATRNSDGSMTFEFAPDMAITAWGLESALRQLNDLLADCVNGTFPRPCTDAERRDIVDTINEIIDVKERMGGPSNPAPGGTRG